MTNSLVKNKLSNNKGVSILFSLLLFLVVTLVSVTIIAAASSSIKRTNSIKNSIESNLALDSAALLLKDQIDGRVYTIKVAATDGSLQKNNASLNPATSLLADQLKEFSYTYANNSKNNINTSATMTPFTIEASNMETVTVSLDSFKSGSSSNESSVTFLLKTHNNNQMYVKFNVTIESVDSRYEIVVTWKYDKASGKSI